MSLPTIELIPYNSPVTDGLPQTLHPDYVRWLDVQIRQRLLAAPLVLTELNRPTQTAAIATAMLVKVTQTATYRVSTYLRITTPGTVSSSATLTLTWTDGGVVCTKTFAAVTGNTTATTDTQTITVHADGGTNLSYAVAYASVGATSMIFRIDLVAEQI